MQGYNACLSVYEHCCFWKDALVLYRHLCLAVGADEVSLNALSSAFASAGLWARAWALLRTMPEIRHVPDEISYNTAMDACKTGGRWLVAFFQLASCSNSHAPGVISYNSALHNLHSATAWNLCWALLQEMCCSRVAPSVVTLNTGLALHERQPHAWPKAESSSRTLWVGDVEHWMDEEFLHRCFSPIGSVTNIKLVRRTNLPSSGGFAFVEFADRAPVADAVDRLEGRAFHALGFNFRVNWAQFSVNDSNLANRNGSGASRGTEYSIYVGGLDFAVKDHDLLNAFMSRYPSAFQAKVGTGAPTVRAAVGVSGEQREAEEAIREMQGVFIGSKAIKPHRDSTPWTVAPPPCPMVPVIDSMAVTTRCAAFGAVLRHVFVEASCFVEFQESTAAEAAASHLAGECGLSVHFSDSATVEYYRSLQLEDGTTRRDGDWPRGE
eukprot:g27323.t1